MLIACDGSVAGLMAVADTIREESRAVVKRVCQTARVPVPAFRLCLTLRCVFSWGPSAAQRDED